MPVNEEVKFTSFLATVGDKLMDEVCLLQDGLIQYSNEPDQASDPGKQSLTKS